MGLEINRNFKDTLFRKIFENKKDLLGAPSVRKVPRGGSCISV